MFSVLLIVATLQDPWSVTPPRPQPSVSAPLRAAPRRRLDIDLSGLSDDDAVAVPGFGASRGRAHSAPGVTWSPRLGQLSAELPPPEQNLRLAPRQVATLALAPFEEETYAGRIDPAIADLIGSVPVPMVSSPRAQRSSLMPPVTARVLASARPRAYQQGRW